MLALLSFLDAIEPPKDHPYFSVDEAHSDEVRSTNGRSASTSPSRTDLR